MATARVDGILDSFARTVARRFGERQRLEELAPAGATAGARYPNMSSIDTSIEAFLGAELPWDYPAAGSPCLTKAASRLIVTLSLTRKPPVSSHTFGDPADRPSWN